MSSVLKRVWLTSHSLSVFSRYSGLQHSVSESELAHAGAFLASVVPGGVSLPAVNVGDEATSPPAAPSTQQVDSANDNDTEAGNEEALKAVEASADPAQTTVPAADDTTL